MLRHVTPRHVQQCARRKVNIYQTASADNYIETDDQTQFMVRAK